MSVHHTVQLPFAERGNNQLERERSPSSDCASAHSVDQAAVYLSKAAPYPPLTLEAEKKLVRKIDWVILPMLFLTATLGAVDKVALGTAALYGLREDLNLKGQQFSWAGSVLSIGSIVGMWPSSYLVHRLPSAKYLCACSIGWSTMTLLIPACRSARGLMALRFFMGFLEAIIVPGISLLIAGFYKKKEQPPRNALVFAAASSVINGFLSWAVGQIPSTAPLRIWQYLFLIVGSISMAWSIIAFILLPDSPMDAFFLSNEEKYHAVQRLAGNKTGIVNKKWKWRQAAEALIDPKTWLLFLFNISINIPNGGLTTFGGLVINGLGFSAVDSSLLNMPTGVMSTLSAFVFSTIAAKWTNRRCLVTIFAAIVPIIGSIIVYTLEKSNIPGQMIGLYFLYTYFGPYVVGISLAQANTAGHTKKNVQYSILYIGYAVGNLIGPQTFRESQAPEYTGGFIAMLICYCACIVLMGTYWSVATWMNTKLDSSIPAISLGDIGAGGHERRQDDVRNGFLDKTDFEQEIFRYTALKVAELNKRGGLNRAQESSRQAVTTMSFHKLAQELLLAIAKHLETDGDISAFARVNPKTYNAAFQYLYRYNARYSGSSALLWAAKVGELETVKQALREGADIDITANNDTTPLELAVLFQREEIVEFLLEQGANSSLDDRYVMLLHLAADIGNERMVDMFLKRGVDPDVKNCNNKTMLYTAVSHHNYRMMMHLFTKGCSPNTKGDGGVTPLHVAAQSGWEEGAALLLDNGASMEQKDIEYGTALHTAVSKGRWNMAKFLLERGASPVLKDYGGQELRLQVVTTERRHT